MVTTMDSGLIGVYKLKKWYGETLVIASMGPRLFSRGDPRRRFGVGFTEILDGSCERFITGQTASSRLK